MTNLNKVQWTNHDWPAILAGTGTAIATIAAAVAAFRKLTSSHNGGSKQPPPDRTLQTIEASMKLIDQLQEENGRLGSRVVELERQRDVHETVIQDLRSQTRKIQTFPYAAQIDPADIGLGPIFWISQESMIVAELDSGRIVLCNQSAARLLGWTPLEIVGTPLTTIIPESLRQRHLDGTHEFLQTGRGSLITAKKPFVLPALRKDGTEVPVEIVLNAVPPSLTKVPGVYAVAYIREKG